MHSAVGRQLFCLTIEQSRATVANAGRPAGRPPQREGNVAKKTQAKKAKPKVKSKSSASRAKVTKVVQGARKKAATIAANPAVTEVVAASLVAAAAAIRDPKKARDIATIVGAELETAS